MSNENVKRGLWSSLGKGYYKHYELIQDVFEYQCINDHKNPGLHQSLMINRKEMGIPDDEWFELRDNCWIQNLWSSVITPKGAFFCEVAGALDMLFNGPGGWKIEKNWWQRTPKEFKEQLHWCELCGAALQTPRRQANEEIDDVGINFYEKLKNMNSRKFKKGNVNLIEKVDNSKKYIASSEWYLPKGDNSQRISDTNKSLYPKTLTGIIFVDENDEVTENIIKDNLTQLDKIIIVADIKIKIANIADIYYVKNLKSKHNVTVINDVIIKYNINDWIIVLQPYVKLVSTFRETIFNYILNPGVLFLSKKSANLADFQILLFNKRASSLMDNWDENKKIDLFEYFNKPTQNDNLIKESGLLAESILTVFETLNKCQEKILLFGAGRHTQHLLDLLDKNNIKQPHYILDDFLEKNQINNIPIMKSNTINKKDFDVIVISAETAIVTEKMIKRVKTLFGEKTKTITLYRNFERLQAQLFYKTLKLTNGIK